VADKALSVAENEMKKALPVSTDAATAVSLACKADADVVLEMINEVDFEKCWGSPWIRLSGVQKRWTAPSQAWMFLQFTHGPVSGEKQCSLWQQSISC
jgi:hypothetical protein